MSGSVAFIQQLRRLGKQDLGGVAMLRRSLGAEPGTDVRVYPFVEPHLPNDYPWTRTTYYLTAGLWATVNTASVLAAAPIDDEESASGATETPAGVEPQLDRTRRDRRTFGFAVATLYLERKKAESIEQRFIALLDADEVQLPYRLRQMVQLVKAEEGIRIHWVRLLDDLLWWNDDERHVQQRWARAFYRATNAAGTTKGGLDAPMSMREA